MQTNEDLLLEIGRIERDILESYFNEIGIFNGTSAIVDLGWKGSMLKSIERMKSKLGYDVNLVGMYLGTHACNTPKLRIESYLMDHGISTGASSADILNDPYIVAVLELIFSAPHESILRLTKNDDRFIPVYQYANKYEKTRINICNNALDGIIDFIKDIHQIEKDCFVNYSYDVAMTPLEYIAKYISKFDEENISYAFCWYGKGNNSTYRPMIKTGKPMIGIVMPWPGLKNAEFEVIVRIRKAARENKIDCVVIDNSGYILDEQLNRTGAFVDQKNLLFVITTHFETPKVLNTFYYHALWNPSEYPMNLDFYVQAASKHYIMNDDFLIYGSGGMKDHLESMLINCPRTLSGASSLVASLSKSSSLSPNLDNPMMFYCGINWDEGIYGARRHGGIFNLLDKTNKVKFFGPDLVEEWGNARPWRGCKSYQYPIPFDGISMVEEINKCGICLVLSSDFHRRAGAATTRIYEACAAGAVIISDDNPFILEHFKDAALFITYNRNNP